LPSASSATPGKVVLYPYQRGWCDAFDDPSIARITVQKSARVGYSTWLVGTCLYDATEDPLAQLVVLPTEHDARDFIVSELEPVANATPACRGRLRIMTDPDGERVRSTVTHLIYAGGSMKVIAGTAPRNYRRHTAQHAKLDEVDALAVTLEGDPVLLAEKRTLSFPRRKIIVGSTPTDAATSHVVRRYAASDQRVFELPCPACGAYFELRWRHIAWENRDPATAHARCPACDARIDETAKPAMVAAGRWRATRPDVVGHAGFKISALVSLLANASWPNLVAEFLDAQDDSDRLKVWTNTLMGEAWADDATEVDERALAARVEPLGLDRMPAAVLTLTAGVDLADDRLEISVLGWSRSEAFILAHHVVWGAVGEDATWRELDAFLRATWTHPSGHEIGLDAVIVDSGNWTSAVYGFCHPRMNRRIFAGKGVSGSRPMIEPSRGKVRGGRLMILGVDTIKGAVMDRLHRARGLRFSDSLSASYFEQLASERKIVRRVRGQPVWRFERKPGALAEALDTVVYAWAARQLATVSLETREATLRDGLPAPTTATAVASPWVSAW
jgi:phage terminase large subunit GpA-like protein